MRALRPLLIALAAAVAFVAPVLAADVTPPNLSAQTTVHDTDLLLIWRNPGPLENLNASVLAGYVQSKYLSTWLQTANNLSDLPNVATARTNLGLGYFATGTSAANLTGTLQAGQEPAHTGDCTNAAGSLALTCTKTNGTALGFFATGTDAGHLTGNINASLMPAFSGDATSSAGSTVLTLAGSGVGAGTYGDSGHVAQVTFDAKGRATGASSVAINYPAQLPSMSGNSGAYLTNNGSSASWSLRLSAYFSSCSSSGCTMAAGNGISGATRNAQGNYTINFSVNMPNTNYTVICTAGAANASLWNTVCSDNTLNLSRQTNSVGIELDSAGSNSPTDNPGGFNILIIQN